MKKHKYTLLVSVTTLIIIVLILFLIMYCIMTYDIKIVKADSNSQIQSEVTPENLLEQYRNISIIFEENSSILEYTYEELGIQPEFTPEQIEYINNNFIIDESQLKPKFNTSKLSSRLELMNNTRQDTVYSILEKTNSGFNVTETILGNKIDISKLYAYISNNVDKSLIKLNLQDFYKELDSTQPTYEELNYEIDKIYNTYIEYQNGFRINITDYLDCAYIHNNTILIDEELLDNYFNIIDKSIERELIEYDTVGSTYEFIDHAGSTIKVSGGTWGNIFSSDDETAYVLDKLKNFEKEENRIPIYSQEMGYEIGDTYVEVSIQDQHVWHVVNGEVCCETDCVTGTTDKRHETPTGVYYICQMQNGRTLWPQGATSGTYVNKWMRITWDGVGLHDAYWRSSFGGNIYTYNGSHGCINLPKQYAYNLYDEVSMNYIVVVH